MIALGFYLSLQNYEKNSKIWVLLQFISNKTAVSEKIQNSFGNEEYSYEELVAEIGSSMALSIFGIVDDLPDNNLAYIQGWVRKLTDQPKMITQASSQAQKAVDYFITTAEKYLNIKDEEKISTLINQ